MRLKDLWELKRSQHLKDSLKILAVLAIYFSLSGLAFAAELKIHSSEGTTVIITPDSGETGDGRNWVRRSEREIDPSTRKEVKVSTTGMQPGGSKASAAGRTFPGVHDKKELIDVAKTYLGSPYKYGGNTPQGIDCSGFVKNVYSEVGVKLPRTAREQFTTGTSTDRGELATGDLIFFGRGQKRDPSHVGIFLKDDKFIHSSARKGGGVRVDSLDDNFYRQTYKGARKLID